MWEFFLLCREIFLSDTPWIAPPNAILKAEKKNRMHSGILQRLCRTKRNECSTGNVPKTSEWVNEHREAMHVS